MIPISLQFSKEKRQQRSPTTEKDEYVRSDTTLFYTCPVTTDVGLTDTRVKMDVSGRRAIIGDRKIYGFTPDYIKLWIHVYLTQKRTHNPIIYIMYTNEEFQSFVFEFVEKKKLNFHHFVQDKR